MIEGASQAAFDGVVTVGTVLSGTQFTYAPVNGTPSGANFNNDMTWTAYATLDNVISRPDGVQDQSGGTMVVSDSYLGENTIVQTPIHRPGSSSTYVSQSGNPNPPPAYAATGGDRYVGLDQFGRVVDQNYLNTGTGTSTDRFQYAYDANSNALYKNIVGQGASGSAYSQLYHVNSSATGDDATAYDNLNRLQAYEQGALSASGNNGSGVLDTVSTTHASGAWTLDALGNWTSVTTNGTPATRSFNAQNQNTTTGSGITYDGDGNITKDDHGITYTYDGWNHLVSETSGSTVGKYAYDGLGRRISDTQITASGSAITFSFFTQAWQVAEDYTATVNASGSVTWGAKYRYIYGPGGINDLVARDDTPATGCTCRWMPTTM